MTEEKRDLTQLVEQLADRQKLPAIWGELKKAGDAALPAIREGLSHPEWRVRQWCAMFLDEHWDVASLQRLVLTLHDPKLKVRRAAVHSLGCDRCKNGESPIDAVPLLAERLREDKSIKVRRTAVMTLAIQQPDQTYRPHIALCIARRVGPEASGVSQLGPQALPADSGCRCEPAARALTER